MSKDVAPTLGEQIDALFELDDQISELSEKVSKLKQQQTEKETLLMEAMKKQGIEQSRGKRGGITIAKAIVPAVKDWDLLYKFVIKHKVPELFERRVGAQKYRELIATIRGNKIPGVESFERHTLSYKTTNA